MVVSGEQDRDRWEQQFRQGGWDFLRSAVETPRYSILGSLLKHLGRPISLLDVGCGEGLILDFCDREWLVNYAGLDPSQTALDRIGNLLPMDRLICSTLEDFTTEQRFDVILFNEVLYYTADPEGHLNKFRNYLHPGGCILISAYRKSGWFSRNSRGVRSVWRLIRESKWKMIDQVVINNIPRKISWNIALMQP